MAKNRSLFIQIIIAIVIVSCVAVVSFYLVKHQNRSESLTDNQAEQIETDIDAKQDRASVVATRETIPPEIKADFTEYKILINELTDKTERLLVAFEDLDEECLPNGHWTFALNDETIELIDEISAERQRFISKHEDAGIRPRVARR